MLVTTNVADLVGDLHAEELRGVADVLARYVALVRKAAEGKTLSPEDAVSAASCAYELRMPADRFDRDVATWRAVAELERQIAEDDANKPTREDHERERAKLAALEKAVVDQKLAMQKMTGFAHTRVARSTHRSELQKANPHLFGNGVLSPNEWAVVRH
jgi:hypothetical protein